MAAFDQEAGYLFKIKVSLEGSSPQVWRQFEIDPYLTLGDLHSVLQRVMGWNDTHLHEFEIKGKRYAMASDEEDLGCIDEETVLMHEIFRPKDRFTYLYDYGDSWMHRVEILKRVPQKKRPLLFRCLDGAGACPPEDSGGIAGYSELLSARNKLQPTADDIELTDWLGDFDPQRFDIDSVKESLAELALEFQGEDTSEAEEILGDTFMRQCCWCEKFLEPSQKGIPYGIRTDEYPCGDGPPFVSAEFQDKKILGFALPEDGEATTSMPNVIFNMCSKSCLEGFQSSVERHVRKEGPIDIVPITEVEIIQT